MSVANECENTILQRFNKLEIYEFTKQRIRDFSFGSFATAINRDIKLLSSQESSCISPGSCNFNKAFPKKYISALMLHAFLCFLPWNGQRI